MKKTNSKAFSLIELSIVILVVGVLIAGVMQGTNMVRKSQLQTARNLTTSSPVSGVKDLMLWYETSLESSFKTTEVADNTKISVWYDNNTQSIAKNNATQATSLNRPKFIENVFGAIPAIRFNGSNERMGFDGTFLAGINYTVFVIEQRRSQGTANFFICGTGNTQYSNLGLGYRASGTEITMSHYAYDMDTSAGTILSYSSPTPRMHSFWFSKTAGMKYWVNGGVNPDQSNSVMTKALVSNAGASLGIPSGSYNGDIADVIIFARDLKNEEKQTIEAYLSKKYNIAITG